MAPAEFHALMDRLRDSENRALVCAGTIAAAVYNVNRDTKRNPKGFTASDIFDLPAPPPPRRTKAEMIKRAENFFGGYNRSVSSLEARRARKTTAQGS